ncbi:MAG: Tex-like N-terminal domain-containing protein [Candidatus Odinarchaeota archaeon]
MDIIKQISKELNLNPFRIKKTLELLDNDNTVPFIARYRKEATGSLDETKLREISHLYERLKNLEELKESTIELIKKQDKLTPELEKKIRGARTSKEVDDLYLPYKKKRKTRADIAREKGLEPLAEEIFAQKTVSGNPEEIAAVYINPDKELETSLDALMGAMDIVAERISHDFDIRQTIRDSLYRSASISVILAESASGQADDATGREREKISKYDSIAGLNESVAKIPPHRILALNRGERERELKVKVDVPAAIIEQLKKVLIRNRKSIYVNYLEQAIEDAYTRLLMPSLTNQLRRDLTERAENHSIKLFQKNLTELLLKPPVKDKFIIGIDPGYRTGCKMAMIDSTGKVLKTGTIYPTKPHSKIKDSQEILTEWIREFQDVVIAIGNGTGSRETEEVIAPVANNEGAPYAIISESGASVYSASPLAGQELRGMGVELRGAVSIARRLQDPLSELVKIDPRSIGIGQYQHDVNQKLLRESLRETVESCVNLVGVDVNTASPALLKYVSGINARLAEYIVVTRDHDGKFTAREDLKRVKGLGNKIFEQCAGFMRVHGSENPLDETSVHPESYSIAEQILELVEAKLPELRKTQTRQNIQRKLKLNYIDIMNRFGKEHGEETVKDILEALGKPFRDPREALPGPVFRKEIISLEEVKEGMIFTGVVSNITDFGIFVDIGVKVDGLVHISEMSPYFVKHPSELVRIGNTVDVEVIGIDIARKRINLSMKSLLHRNKQVELVKRQKKVRRRDEREAEKLSRLKSMRVSGNIKFKD